MANDDHINLTEVEKALVPLRVQLWARHRSMMDELCKATAAIHGLTEEIRLSRQHPDNSPADTVNQAQEARMPSVRIILTRASQVVVGDGHIP